MWLEYGLEENYALDKEGGSEDGEAKAMSRLQLSITNSLLVLRDGQPSPIDLPGDKKNFLFIGSLGSAYNLSALQAASITHILCLSGIVRMKYYQHSHHHSFVYLRLPMEDKIDFPLESVLDEAIAFIDSAATAASTIDGKVLVHCYQGRSRCAAVCCAYLMLRHDYTLNEALSTVQKARPIAQPNTGFMTTLCLLQNKKNKTQSSCHHHPS
eukprot:gene370-401_t